MKSLFHAWQGRRVLVTGHTGFKGGWLCLVLKSLGAEVHGISLPPETPFFEAAQVGEGIDSTFLDIRDLQPLKEAVAGFSPEVFFHLAAQPLVRASYRSPVETYATNVMGTAHVLEAARGVSGLRSVVVVTSDKCYENREWDWGYRENDPMGGRDPYSSSKGCAEILASSWAHSFFQDSSSARVATARAGNVIGGGDWSADRLVPDALQAFSQSKTLKIRRPDAVRPWQHVLEPIHGYLMLAEYIIHQPAGFAGGWNFGPSDKDMRPVREVVERLHSLFGEGAGYELDEEPHPHEAGLLKLDCSKAAMHLNWRPRIGLEEALAWTVDWHRAHARGEDLKALIQKQITLAGLGRD